jgi:hypothetical protein
MSPISDLNGSSAAAFQRKQDEMLAGKRGKPKREGQPNASAEKNESKVLKQKPAPKAGGPSV